MSKRIAWLCAIALFVSLAIAADFPEGTKVEVREGDVWSPAVVVKKEGRKTQVKYDDGTTDWVMPDRLRAASGAASTVTPPKPNEAAKPGDAAKPAPAEVTLDSPFTEINLDNVQESKKATGASVSIAPTTRPSDPFLALKVAGDEPVGDIKRFIVPGNSPGVMLAVAPWSNLVETQIIKIDTTGATPVETRRISAKEESVLAAADGGRVVMTTPEPGRSVTFHIWEWDKDQYRLKGAYTLSSKSGGKPVDFAFMPRDGRVLLGTRGEVYLIDLKSRHALGMVKGARDKRSLHPSGQILELEGMLCRTSDLAIMTELPNGFGQHNTSVDPTGTLAAYGPGGLKIVKVPSGLAVADIKGVFRGGEEISLVNTTYVMVSDKDDIVVYDIKTSVPVWRYTKPTGTPSVQLGNGDTLFAFREGVVTKLVMAILPDAKASAALKAATPDSYALSPGTQIHIEGDLNAIYGNGAAAKDNIEKSLKESGHKLVASGGLKLEVTSKPGPTTERRFNEPGMHFGPPPVRVYQAPSTIVDFKLMRDNEVIWTRTDVFAMNAPIVMLHGGQTMEQAIADAAKPDINRLKFLAMPSYIVKGTYSNGPATLGSSSISSDGFGPTAEPPAAK